MATLTWPRNYREGCRKTRLSKSVAGMTPESPNTCLKEAIAASLGTRIEAPVTPEDICPDHLYPRRTGAVKEYDKQLKQLSTENFKLKLEIYFLLNQDKKEDEPTNELQEQIQLQVKAEELRKELDYKNNLLRETLKTLQQLETNCAQTGDARDSQMITDCDITEKQLSSVETVNSSSFLNEMYNNNEQGDQAQGNSMQDMEEAINILLAVATASRENETQETATCQNSFQTIFQKLQEPISKKCMLFLRALYHLKEQLKEKDEKIRFLEASLKKHSLPSELDSSDNSMESYTKDQNVKVMEQELNSLHNAIREKEIFIKELLDEKTSMVDDWKAGTENYLSIITKIEEEKIELQQVILGNRDHMDKMETEINVLVQKMEQEHQKVLTEPRDRQSQLDKLNNEKEEIQKILQKVEECVLTKEAEISELKVILSTKDAELEVVLKNLKDAQNELVRLKAVTVEKEKEVDDAKKYVYVLELEREALKTNYADLETAFDNLERLFSESGMLKEAIKSPKWDSNLKDDLATKERELFNACTKLQHLSELLEAEKKDKMDLLHQFSYLEQQDRGNSNTFQHAKDRRSFLKTNHFFEESNEKLENQLSGRESGTDATLKRQLECKDAELHELRKRYKESVERVISLEKALNLQLCRIKYQETSGHQQTLDVEISEKSQTKIQNNAASVDQLEPESNPESLISIYPSLYRKSLTCDFSKFGQTNDVLDLKEEIFLIMLHIHQLEFEFKEKTKGLTSQLTNTQSVCKMLHDHLEELSEFMEKLLQSEDISQLIRSSMTSDCLSRLENLLYHDLDQSLNLSRSVWMVDRECSMNTMLPSLDQLDMEPSKDRDLSIITVTSHIRQDGAIAESSDAFDKSAAGFSGRRSSKGGKLRSDKLDEMIKKGEKMCLEMRRLNIHNNELMSSLLKKLEGSDSNLTQQIDKHLKILRNRIENMISHCAKLFETFKIERSQKQLTEEKLEDSQNKYASLQDAQRRVSSHDYKHDDLEACHYDISVCLQELLDVQQKIGSSIHSNESDDHNQVKTKSKIGARLLHTARRTVEGLQHQIVEKESAWREREVELLQYHHEFGVCLQELRHIQQKVGNQNQSTDCVDEGPSTNDLPTKLQQAIRKTIKNLLQQITEKEGALKLCRERNLELERSIEVKKREIKQIQDWCFRLQKEDMEKAETKGNQMDIAEKLSGTRIEEVESEHSKCQQQARELELLREVLEQQERQEKNELQSSRTKICALEEEIKSLKATGNKELQLQQETANCAMEKSRESNLQLRNELQQTKKHYDDLKNQVSRLQSEMESALQTDVSLQEKNQIICTLELETSKLKQQLETLTGDLLDLREKVCQSNIHLQEKDEMIHSMQLSSFNLTKQLQDFLKEKKLLEENLSQATTDLQEKKGLISSLQESLADFKHEMENILMEKERLHEIHGQKDSNLQKKDNLIQSLEVQIFTLKQEIQDATKEQEKLREKECQSDLDVRQKEKLIHALQVQINKLQQEVKNSTKQQQKLLQDKMCQTAASVEEKDHLILSLEVTNSKLKAQLEDSEREKLELGNKCQELQVECRKQQVLLESKVSREDAEVNSSTFTLQQEVNSYMQKFQQLEEWNLGIQQQVQEKERLWEDEKESLKKENFLLRKKLKKTSLKKGTEISYVEHSSSSEANHNVQRLQKELKEAAQLNASLQLELKVYQHLGHNSSEGLPHQKDMLLELVEEMRQLRGELMRSVRANSKLRHQLESYIRQDARGKKPDLALTSCTSSSDNVHQLSQIACSPSLEAVATLLPTSRLSSDSSLNARVRHLLGVPTLRDRTSQPDGSSSSNEDLRSIYSSPDLGIESDPNRDSSSTTSGHAVKVTSIQRFSGGISFTDKIFDSFAGAERNSLHVVGHLETFELLQKQVAESLVVLRGVKARLQDRLHNVSNISSPTKNMEYNTLKELDRSCYYLQVYLEKGKTLLSSFRLYPQISPLLEENSKLREEVITLHAQVKEQSSQLQTALEKLTLTESKKEVMERAITKKLSKTRKVLKQAKCNLLDENRKQTPQPTSDAADGRRLR